MDSLVGYGSDEDNETDRVTSHHYSGPTAAAGSRRRDDDTNYDDVNMDMSEDSDAESEPELPPADRPTKHSHDDRRNSNDSRGRGSDHDRRERRRDSPSNKRPDRDRDRDRNRRSPRRDDRADRHRSERAERGRNEGSRRGLLGDKPDEKSSDSRSSDKQQVPALMDLKPFGGEPPPCYSKSQDARDAVSPRFSDRGDRRERDRGRERDRDRHSRRSEERRSGSKHRDDREHRSRSRGAAFPPPGTSTSSSERRGSPPSGDYRPSSYKVNKKLEVMEKMGLQIKTPDGSMATAQQLRAAASEAPLPSGAAPSYYNPGTAGGAKILDQVQKRKLLWSNKSKCESEEASKWSGTRFANDDGKQVSKFMRLMGIKDPEKVKPEADKAVDPIKKQEELFQAMQAQYEVARATTHTMRGVGLGFQRGQY